MRLCCTDVSEARIDLESSFGVLCSNEYNIRDRNRKPPKNAPIRKEELDCNPAMSVNKEAICIIGTVPSGVGHSLGDGDDFLSVKTPTEGGAWRQKAADIMQGGKDLRCRDGLLDWGCSTLRATLSGGSSEISLPGRNNVAPGWLGLRREVS